MTAKIAISLPEDLLRAVEKECRITGESRSSIFRRAVELLIKQQQEQEDSKNYMRGYEQLPETADEVEAALSEASTILSGEPWP